MGNRGIAITLATVAAAVMLSACGRNDPAKYIASAESYVNKAQYPAAIIELKNALATAPDNARARYLLGISLLASGDPTSAETELRKALTLKYAPDEVYPALARAWVMQGAPRQRLDEIANAPVTSPAAKAEMARMLANAYLDYGEPKEARTYVDRALALEPANVPTRLLQARIAAADNDSASAAATVESVLAVNPDDVDALILKADLLAQSGQRGEAARALEKVVAIKPMLFQPRYSLAVHYVQLREFDKAGKEVEALLKQGPSRSSRSPAAICRPRSTPFSNRCRSRPVSCRRAICPDSSIFAAALTSRRSNRFARW
jgi:cellulose synthase operon protein C